MEAERRRRIIYHCMDLHTASLKGLAFQMARLAYQDRVRALVTNFAGNPPEVKKLQYLATELSWIVDMVGTWHDLDDELIRDTGSYEEYNQAYAELAGIFDGIAPIWCRRFEEAIAGEDSPAKHFITALFHARQGMDDQQQEPDNAGT